ncbi:hypothetical protein B9Z55_019442 [Caenorhabditis nigoni]|uniref:Uncharacterized protein n=1 Tax=Caenorhabditis nigoni TaxID=1611254 RepID=A0A2G5TIE7_9PELO|nr:hypothetical protein B9Z55_019442 [Caenorhabditis nigoni]
MTSRTASKAYSRIGRFRINRTGKADERDAWTPGTTEDFEDRDDIGTIQTGPQMHNEHNERIRKSLERRYGVAVVMSELC